ncbi:MAG: carotenoid oxygenase family protein [Acidimicrobiales bacterium]|nr:carotenoid oxygenase family protein [Acidimicrobiales bacterium]
MSIYLEGAKAPVDSEITAFDLEVTGKIPEELEGRWLRNGPNPFGPVDAEAYHWFLGDGMIHGVRLRGGKAEWYRNRWVRGRDLAEKLQEEPPVGSSFGDSGFSPNTSVIGHAGTTFALVEAGTTPVAMKYDLETVGYDNFGGTLPGAFSAHTKFDPVNKELHAVCYAYPDILDRLQHVVIGEDNRVKKVTDIPIEGMPMVHDMSLTEKYAIIYDLPVCVDLDLAIAGDPFPIAWQNDRQSRIGLLPRNGQASDIIWCEAPSCYVFHPVNAFEVSEGQDDNKIIIDLCRYERVFQKDLKGPAGDTPSQLARWTVDPATRTVSEEIVSDLAHEFPAHDPRTVGRRHRYAYTAVGFDLGPTYRTDMETGEVVFHDHGEGRFGGEPIFVPREGSTSEEDGWVLVCVNDRMGSPAELVILDANNIEEKPVARIHLPQRVPDGFHGAWVPDSVVSPDE